MKRLTYRDEEGAPHWRQELLDDDTGWAGELIRGKMADLEDAIGDCDIERLKVIMTQCMSMREEVSERFRITGSIPVDRLRDLVEADKAGRCVVLPVKPGDTVWYLTGNPSMTNRLCFDHVDSARVVGFYFDKRGMQVRLDYFHGSHGTYGFYGKTVFSTREAAEAALAKETDHE